MNFSAPFPLAASELTPGLLRRVAPRILLVEDDDRQRALLQQLLEDQGYDVEAVGSASVAIAHMRSTFELMITDVDLGSRITGIDLARLVRSAQPALPVLILSAREPELAEGQAITFLRKPCTSGTILAKVNALVTDQ